MDDVFTSVDTRGRVDSISSASSVSTVEDEMLSPAVKGDGQAGKGEKKASLGSRFISQILSFGNTTLDTEAAKANRDISAAKADLRKADAEVARLKRKHDGIAAKLEKLAAKDELTEKEAQQHTKLTSDLETVTQDQAKALDIQTERRESVEGLMELAGKGVKPSSVAAKRESLESEEDDGLLEVDTEGRGSKATLLPTAEHEEDVFEEDEEDLEVVPGKAKGDAKPFDVLAVGPKSTIGTNYADIVLNEGTVVGPMLRAALKTKVLCQNTQIAPHNVGGYDHLAVKGVETVVHGATATLSEIAGWAILLPAVGLDHLVGSLDDVKETYHSLKDKLMDNGAPAGIAATAAGIATAGHLIAWVMKHIAIFAAAGLTIAINSTLAIVDKVISGAVALAVHGVVGAAKFAWKHKGKLVGAGVIAGSGVGLKFALAGVTGAAVGAGIVAFLPYIAMAAGGLLAIYLVLRGARYVYDHGFTLGRHDDRLLHKFSNTALLGIELRNVRHHDGGEAELSEEAAAETNELYKTYYGSKESRKYKRASVDATNGRVISCDVKHYANALGRDMATTFSFQWNSGRDDASITRRQLVTMTDEDLAAAVADYKVDKKIISAHDVVAVKAAHFASLKAARDLARHEATVRHGRDEIPEEKQQFVLSDDKVAELTTVVNVLSGSDVAILAAINKHGNRMVPAADREDVVFRNTLKTSDEGPNIDFIDCVACHLAEANIEKMLNAVTVRRELATLQKKATAMNKAMFEKKSGFRRFLETKGYTVDMREDKLGITVTDAGEEALQAFFNPNKVGKTEGLEFGDASFKTMFGVQDVEIEADTTVTDITTKPMAHALVALYDEYTAKGFMERRALSQASRVLGSQDEQALAEEEEFDEEEEAITVTTLTGNADAAHIVSNYGEVAGMISLSEYDFNASQLAKLREALDGGKTVQVKQLISEMDDEDRGADMILFDARIDDIIAAEAEEEEEGELEEELDDLLASASSSRRASTDDHASPRLSPVIGHVDLVVEDEPVLAVPTIANMTVVRRGKMEQEDILAGNALAVEDRELCEALAASPFGYDKATLEEFSAWIKAGKRPMLMHFIENLTLESKGAAYMNGLKAIRNGTYKAHLPAAVEEEPPAVLAVPTMRNIVFNPKEGGMTQGAIIAGNALVEQDREFCEALAASPFGYTEAQFKEYSTLIKEGKRAMLIHLIQSLKRVGGPNYDDSMEAIRAGTYNAHLATE